MHSAKEKKQGTAQGKMPQILHFLSLPCSYIGSTFKKSCDFDYDYLLGLGSRADN